MHSSRYTILYAFVVTVVVAVALAATATGLRSRQDANEAQARRSAILESVMDVHPETVTEDYERFITERVFDATGNPVPNASAFDLDIRKEAKKAPSDRLLPLFEFRRDGETSFIVPLRGTGLWGPLSAYLALESDLNTVRGVVFEHEKETPGLGAEITTPAFEGQFVAKRLFGADGQFESIRVLKGTGNDIAGNPHLVDGLTGATMTMNGVSRMLHDEVMLYTEVFRRMGS